MVDVNNGLVGIVWALTGKNKKDEFYVQGLCRRREWEKLLGSGRKRQWRGQIRKSAERTGVRRMEKRDGEKNGRVGKKYKGWKR